MLYLILHHISRSSPPSLSLSLARYFSLLLSPEADSLNKKVAALQWQFIKARVLE